MSALPNRWISVTGTSAAATLLMDGRVFICGGVGPSAGDSVEIYDPDTGTFTLLPGKLSVGRHGHTVVRIDTRRMLFYGGFTLDGQVAPPELYDPIDGVSTPLPPAEPNTRGNHEAHTMLDGGILILGGEDGAASPLTTVLRFDPASSQFGAFASLLGRVGRTSRTAKKLVVQVVPKRAPPPKGPTSAARHRPSTGNGR